MRIPHLAILLVTGLSFGCASLDEDLPSGAAGGADESSSESVPVQSGTPEVDPDNPNDETNTSEVEPSEARLPTTGDAHRDAAQEFSLDIIQTYFDENADLFETFLHDPILLAGTNTVYTREEYADVMLNPAPFPAGHDLTAYTMNDYLRVYDPGVYTFQEASDLFGLPLFDEDGWVPEDDEYLFVGFFRADGVPYSEEFIAIGLVTFVVAEREGDWKIVGLIPHP